MEATGDIRDKVEQLLPGKEFFVVDISLTGGKGHRHLEVLVDGDHGIDLNECTRISRELSDWLDHTTLIDGPYVLEVGSPGVDYPMRSSRQYAKNNGRTLKGVLNDDSVVMGRLVRLGDRQVELESPGKGKKDTSERHPIGFDQIRKSTVIVSFK